MKHIALIDNDYYDRCWPKQAEKEYVQLFGKERLHRNENYEVSLWMGEWLIKNRDKFVTYGEISRWVEDPEPNKVYVYKQSNYFGWTNPVEEDEDIYVRVEEIPDDMLWNVETSDDDESEWLVLYRQPKENGLLRRKLSWEKE
jgi:hypothetical protein